MPDDELLRRAVGAAWHEFRYPRPAIDEPTAAFRRAIAAALAEVAGHPTETISLDLLTAIAGEIERDNPEDGRTVPGKTWVRAVRALLMRARRVARDGESDGG